MRFFTEIPVGRFSRSSGSSIDQAWFALWTCGLFNYYFLYLFSCTIIVGDCISRKWVVAPSLVAVLLLYKRKDAINFVHLYIFLLLIVAGHYFPWHSFKAFRITLAYLSLVLLLKWFDGWMFLLTLIPFIESLKSRLLMLKFLLFVYPNTLVN